jgi:hypothetical protein
LSGGWVFAYVIENVLEIVPGFVADLELHAPRCLKRASSWARVRGLWIFLVHTALHFGHLFVGQAIWIRCSGVEGLAMFLMTTLTLVDLLARRLH